MPSSPAERSGTGTDHGAAPSGSELLRAMARAYDEALVAAASDDLDACMRLVDAAGTLLAAAPADDPAEPGLREEARAAHARLAHLLQDLLAETGTELAEAKHGRKALNAYAGLRTLGARVESRA